MNTDLHNTYIGESLAGYQCHEDAIFDIDWAPADMELACAAGDQRVSLWQCRPTGLAFKQSYMGHNQSVKCVSFCRTHPNHFASGGRDGALNVWDNRYIGLSGWVNNGHTASSGYPRSITSLAFPVCNHFKKICCQFLRQS